MPPVDLKKTRQTADELEKQLDGHLFLGGAKPTAKDVETFRELFGGEENVAVYRWLRHIASFTESERASWGAPESR
ncbi:25 Kd elongation factor 1-beta [Angomonas deanei]|uniref:Uncharacterized protein n=1 Tax=Angomonas deanei TaxID=59799 RepID=A0A7G2CAA9_9TRYP|nr:25 Kd elongation factor 1-beta [Angomonas deanei]CAD2215693.1 hypothetical protein, conserved [Angomonas deanei]|eukprot:EPY38371.1 25 Kd elongation factor 1-beta [Angomonas deanei]